MTSRSTVAETPFYARRETQSDPMFQVSTSARALGTGGVKTRALTVWKVLACFSLSDKIFHDTFSMKAPRSPSEFLSSNSPSGKVNRRLGIAGLTGLGIQMIRP